MANRTALLPDELYSYILKHSISESQGLKSLREETEKLAGAAMQTSPEQVRFLQLLMRLMGAKNTIEIGVFTGYCTMGIAQILPNDGKIIACDVNREYTDIALKHWMKAGVAHKILLKLSPALQTLDDLISAGRENSFDFAYIDADKREYDGYYEKCLKLVRPRGVVALDNVLWAGSVVKPEFSDEYTCAIRAINAKVANDARVFISMLPIGDGLTLAMKL